MHFDQNYAPVNVNIPVPHNQVLQNKWYSPMDIPRNVSITFTPETSYYFSRETLQTVTGHLVGTIQHRAQNGGPMSVFLYNLVSANGYSNDYFAKMVQSVFEILDPADDDGNGISEIIVTDAVHDVIDTYYAVCLHEYPDLTFCISQDAANKILRKASHVANIRARQMQQNQNTNQYQHNQNMPVTQTHNPIFPNQSNGHAHSNLNSSGVQFLNQNQQHNMNNGMMHSNQFNSNAINQPIDSNNMYHGNMNQPHNHNAGINMQQNNPLQDPNLQFIQSSLTNQQNATQTHPQPNLNNHEPVNQFTVNEFSPTTEIKPSEETCTDVRYMRLSDNQKNMVDEQFNGEIPEGSVVIPYDSGNGAEHSLLLPIEALDGIYDPQSTFKRAVGKGINDTYNAHVPMFNSHSSRLCAILEPDGTRHYLIDDKRDANMNIEDHIPPGATVDWKLVQDKTLTDSEGTPLNNGKAFVFDSPIIGTPNLASATANYALRSKMDKCSYGQETKRVVEYRINNANSFYVENPIEVLNVLKLGKKCHNMIKMIKDMKHVTNDNPKLRKYVDETATKIINEFTLYSIGADVVIDSFLDDYLELIEIITEEYGPAMVMQYEKARDIIVDKICTAVSASKIEDFTLPITVADDDGEEDTEKNSKITSNLILMVEMSQITEIPFKFEDLGIGVYSPHELSKEHGMIDRDVMPDLYDAVKTIVLRQGASKIVPSAIETIDGVKLSIHRSAYDQETFILVKEN